MINWSWRCILSEAGCGWSSTACRYSAMSYRLQPTGSESPPTPDPTEHQVGEAEWVDRCRRGQRLLCSYQHESELCHRTSLSLSSAALQLFSSFLHLTPYVQYVSYFLLPMSYYAQLAPNPFFFLQVQSKSQIFKLKSWFMTGSLKLSHKFETFLKTYS